MAREPRAGARVGAAALALVGPVVLALLHQVDLLGSACRPLDIDAFIEVHIQGWLEGHRTRRGFGP